MGKINKQRNGGSRIEKRQIKEIASHTKDNSISVVENVTDLNVLLPVSFTYQVILSQYYQEVGIDMKTTLLPIISGTKKKRGYSG